MELIRQPEVTIPRKRSNLLTLTFIVESSSYGVYNLMRNRAWRDIIADVLLTTAKGSLKTTIMRDSRLSFLQLEKYLNGCLDLGLLIRQKENRLYVTTEKGREYMKIYDTLNEFTEFKEI